MEALRFVWMLTLLSALSGCFVWSGIDEPNGGRKERIIPARPSADTSSENDSQSLSLAAYDIEMIQEGERWREVGYNLDGVETYGENGISSCNPPKPDASPPEDGENGIDNQFGAKVTPLLKIVLPTALCEMAGSHFAGHGTFAATIEKWNGTPNDARLTAYISSAVHGLSTPDGIEPDPSSLSWEPLEGGDGFELLVDGEPARPPCFDGNDFFYPSSDDELMRPADAQGNRLPRVIDTEAYMVDNTIVARVPLGHSLTIMSLFRSLPARIGGGFIIATFDEDYERVAEGTLVGRFLQENIADVAPHIGACNETLLGPFRSIIGSSVDIMADPTRDHMNETCDAISIGIQFKAVRVNISSTLGPEWAPPKRCTFERAWDADKIMAPLLYGCEAATSTYDWGKEWKSGKMEHCQNGTLLSDLIE